MAIRIRGMKETLRNLRRMPRTLERALGAALYAEGQGVLSKSQRLVPVDTGRLRATGYVAPPEKIRGELAVEVGYGTEYAVPVHERTDVHHPNGQSKFLEAALNAQSDGYAGRVARRTRAALKAGVGFGGAL